MSVPTSEVDLHPHAPLLAAKGPVGDGRGCVRESDAAYFVARHVTHRVAILREDGAR